MKFMNFVLSTVIALSATKGFASEQNTAPLTAGETLALQYAELEDLQNQIQRIKALQGGGPVLLVLSMTAVTVGFFMDFANAFKGAWIPTVSMPLGQGKQFSIRFDQALILGGASAMVGTSLLMMLSEDKLAQLEKEVERLQEQIKLAHAQLN